MEEMVKFFSIFESCAVKYLHNIFKLVKVKKFKTYTKLFTFNFFFSFKELLSSKIRFSDSLDILSVKF